MKTIYTYSLPPESSLSVPAVAVTGNHLLYKTYHFLDQHR